MQNSSSTDSLYIDVTDEYQIPQEILHEICLYLDPKSLFSVCFVSHAWYEVCELVKWESILPSWKVAKIPKEYTYQQRREHAKREMREFFAAKKATKYTAKLTRISSQIGAKMELYSFHFEKTIYVASAILLFLFVVLQGYSDTTASFSPAIIWTVYVLVMSYTLYPETTRVLRYNGIQLMDIAVLSLPVFPSFLQLYLIVSALGGSVSWFTAIIPVSIAFVLFMGIGCYAKTNWNPYGLFSIIIGYISVILLACYFENMVPLSVPFTVIALAEYIFMLAINEQTVRTEFHYHCLISLYVSQLLFLLLQPYRYAWYSWLLCSYIIYKIVIDKVSPIRDY
jgi:hypothetical protein